MYNNSIMDAMICIYSVQPYISKYISINITVTSNKYWFIDISFLVVSLSYYFTSTIHV